MAALKGEVAGGGAGSETRTWEAWIEEHGSPLLLLNCDEVRLRYRRLAAALPGVDVHYAIKALPHPAVLTALDQEGSSYDVSSIGEVHLLRELGITPDRMIQTHPIKSHSSIRESIDYGCRSFVVDNDAEMEKFVPYRDRVSLLLRIGFRSDYAVVDLAKKFGCAPEDAFGLLERGRALGLTFQGLSFHVGSQCFSPGGHVAAIEDCRALIDRARRENLADMRVIDIGGGFPVSYVGEAIAIETFCQPIREALDRLPPGMRVIAEPGRYLVAPAMEAVSTVIGKARRGGTFWYYLDDGVYGSYNGRVYDPAAHYPLRALRRGDGVEHRSVLAGPTCDSIDIIADGLLLPELEIGDLIVGSILGAYSAAAASEFNSIPRTKIVVVDSVMDSGAISARANGGAVAAKL
jgi:ornithine decarboxylase